MDNEISFTPSQQSAITVKANKILVSAAAGSGKSSVLTERIIRKITDKNAPCDLQDLIVVTFTRASADDLKSKITKAIKTAVEKEPSDRLSKQLMKLPSAKINTIHGICFSLIKANFEALSLPASITVADENFAQSLKLEVLNDFLDYCYSGLYSPIPSFDTFVENFINERDDNLVNILLGLYAKIKNCPDGFNAFLTEENVESADFMKTPYGKVVANRLEMLIDYYKKSLCSALEYTKINPDYSAFSQMYSDHLEYLKRIENALNQESFALIQDVLIQTKPVASGRLSISSALKTDIGEFYRDEKKALMVDIEALSEEIFSYTEQQLKDAMQKNSQIKKQLISLLYDFDIRFSEAKLKRSMLDFNDLEHYTLKLLYDKNGEISEFAKHYSGEISEIYVDEYQDLNPLQNKIFTALSVNCPIFMVGDIKQSIYGFRGADPSAFADFKRRFPEYEKKQNEYDCVTVFLSKNFRSLLPILEFTNRVSDAMFDTPNVNEELYAYRIPYKTADRLNCGRKYDDEPPKITLLNCEVPTVKGGNPQKNASTHAQAKMVALEIKKLLENGIMPDEIAIIMRSLKTNGPIFEEEFKNKGIPLDSSKGAKLFEKAEIHLALCLLNCCDNPYRDIFLAGALRSPIFGFSLSDLINIRTSEKDADSLFEALCSYTEKNNLEKGRYFLEMLEKLRKFSTENTVDKLLWQIYTETQFFSIIYDGTTTYEGVRARRANLLLLHEIAKSMSNSGKNGLYAFVENIRLLIEQDKSPYAAESETKSIKMFSIHASKGLEFKYCFVCGLTTTLNESDLSSDILLDENVGFAVKIKDELRLTSTDTPMRKALAYKQELDSIDEEMRMLYVALTRAQDKMYLCSSVNKFEEKRNTLMLHRSNLHPYLFISKHGFFNWIFLTLDKIPSENCEYEIKNYICDEIYELYNALSVYSPSVSDKTELTSEEKKILAKEVKSRLTFEYPYKHSLILPSKLSVSRLYPDFLDEDEYFGAAVDADAADFELEKTKDNVTELKTPRFMLDSIPISAADKGTATHIFMQFCDFSNVINNGIDAEIARLVERRFITKEQADLIEKKYISAFLKSDVFKEMSSSAEMNREYRFNIKLPAKNFTKNPELKEALEGEYVFVQGVIDCYFYDKNGNINIVDYKTDSVPKDILGDVNAENIYFTKKHSQQLFYYKTALEILTGRKVSKTLIYSFALGRCIELN